MNEICRSCMAVNVNFINIFKDESNSLLAEKYYACTSIKIFEDDGLPPYLCNRCESSLENFFQFKVRSTESDALLKVHFKNDIKNEFMIESSSIVKEETDELIAETSEVEIPKSEIISVIDCEDKNVLQLEEENVKEILKKNVTKLNKTTTNKCPECGKIFIKEGNYQRHLKLHQRNASTEIKSSKINSQSLDEKENSSSEEKLRERIQCPACNKDFVKQGSLIKHLGNHDNLDKKFPIVDKLLRKKQFKEKQRHLCKECGKSFSRKDFLSFHKKSMHNQGQPISKRHLCVHCGKCFDYASNFLIHVRRHTGDLPYKCKECKKAFPRFHDLKCHERQHSGEKPYLCSICGKSFGLQYKLTRHMRVHTGEKPYKCKVCLCSFAQSNDLVNHSKRTHSFACSGCTARFVMRISLEKHCNDSGHTLDYCYKNQKMGKKEIKTTAENICDLNMKI